MLASQQSDLAVADSLGYEALALFRELGDQRGVGWTLHVLGWNAMARGAYGEARRLFEEAADAHSGPGDQQLQRRALMALAHVLSFQGDHARAVRLLRDVVASTRREGSTLDLALALGNLGVAEDVAGETEQGRRSLEESIALSRQDGRKPVLAIGLCNLGYLLRSTAPVEALAHFSESLSSLARSRTRARSRTASREAPGSSPRAATSRTPRPARCRLRHPRADRRGFLPRQTSRRRHPRGAVPRSPDAEAFARAWDRGVARDANAAADWALRLFDESE